MPKKGIGDKSNVSKGDNPGRRKRLAFDVAAA
jgi:hypothetical protein